MHVGPGPPTRQLGVPTNVVWQIYSHMSVVGWSLGGRSTPVVVASHTLDRWRRRREYPGEERPNSINPMTKPSELACGEWCAKGPYRMIANSTSRWVHPKWDDVPEDHASRDQILAFGMGTHARAGAESIVRCLDESIMYLISTSYLQIPVVVPDDYSTLSAATNATMEGQTILMRKGLHSLQVGLSNPTLVNKRLIIEGEPGAVLYGGLQCGKQSSGRIHGVEVRGHLWIYGGEWDVQKCRLRNRLDVAIVVSNLATVVLSKCVIGGATKRKASDGIIAHGQARVRIEECDIQRCRHSAVTTGGQAGVILRTCAFFDNQSCFRVFSPGMKGDFLEVSDCVVKRGGRIWADALRPLRVAGQRNFVHEEEMGERFWEMDTSMGSWARTSELPGGLTLLPAQGTAAA